MTITTVLGPVDGHKLGRVDAHEHLFLRSPILPGDHFQDLGKMTQELTFVRDSGIDTVVDLTPIGLGRRPTWTAELSRQTGVHVILATGVHRKAHYPFGHWLYDIGVDDLADLLVTDLERGIDERDWQGPRPAPTRVRAGIIKLGASYHAITPSERIWLEAGAQAAVRTGAPVAVHCEVGTTAHDILDFLESFGVAPNRVMLAHLDRNIDPELHADVASRGAFLGYDTIGRTKYHSDATVLDLIARVHELGQAGQVLLGTDVGRSSMLRAYGGGPGMDVLGRVFVPRLRVALGSALVGQVMVSNPRRFLTGEFETPELCVGATPGD
jgi:predicted metal-dependent phosphotriesterase family hydrolase